jgi:Ala-tRNA(Pro) deacylase
MAIPITVEQFLKDTGCRYRALPHPLAFTAQHEAAVTHVKGHEWAKTVVCFADDAPVLAVLPAHLEVDIARLRLLTGASIVRLAKEQEFARLYRDCETGAMPPLGPLFGQRVFVDESLTHDPEIAFHAGTHTDAVLMPFADFARAVKPVVGRFAHGPHH